MLSLIKKLLSPSPKAEKPVTASGAPAADPAGFVEYVVRSLVDEPASVEVKVDEKERETAIRIGCAKQDMGKIIGKSGKTIAAIRTLASSAGGRLGKKVSVEIIE
ncbi:MAG: KH domain-containing protein [Kiritimatiellaeota bacterium]|nr:KH domain-containing protein [Kiritimatiellota bacterium]